MGMSAGGTSPSVTLSIKAPPRRRHAAIGVLDQHADDRIGEAPFGSNGVKSLSNARQRIRFGAHPMNPFLSVGREIVMLADRAQGLELFGHHATLDTNFSNALVSDVESGFAFAAGIGFPAQGVIVIGCRDGLPAPDIALIKDRATPISCVPH